MCFCPSKAYNKTFLSRTEESFVGLLCNRNTNNNEKREKKKHNVGLLSRNKHEKQRDSYFEMYMLYNCWLLILKHQGEKYALLVQLNHHSCSKT